ncbi:asparaginase [Crassaminicella thermophila]|uniref:Asparaginase n=1 Tax=Crassaminicella thermophila TaxID=2599308 RepID=A0A5C0SIZ4_CRATE|nr:asparaginase [Crassaminicella thermophila]
MSIFKVAEVYRGEIMESSHLGHIAVVDWKGKLLYSGGNPYRITYARSSIKPIQAIPIVETGTADRFHLSDADLALNCASHSGEIKHTNGILSMLRRGGIGVDSLQCGEHIPLRKDVYENLIKQGEKLTPLYNNCSGKHVGMLLTAIHMGEPLENYYKIEHPVQQRIIKTLSEIAKYPIDKIQIGIDGCGVPVHAMPLERLAYAFARMTKPKCLGEIRAKACERITNAMMNHSDLVAGTGRFCTEFMKTAKGRMFGKAGAEAVYLIGDKKTGIGVAIKIEDGNARAMYTVALEVLRQLDLITKEELEELRDYYMPKVRNARNEEVGRIVPSFTLQKC